MENSKKYTSPIAMRTALEQRLKTLAHESNQDIMRLRRQISFDRFLARLFSGEDSNRFVLKGGYSIELRLSNARTTKDIDISFDDRTINIINNPTKFRELVQKATRINLNDYFEYTVGESILDLENALYGGFRFPVECKMAGRRFSQFHIDIASGDIWLNTHEELLGHRWLEFAGIETPKFSTISSEQQFAEKVHSYSVPRKTQNSRVKDLVDMFLLIDNSKLVTTKLHDAIKSTFSRRKTHDIPSKLNNPPDLWKVPFEKLAKECGILDNMDLIFRKVQEFYKVL